VPDWTIKNTRDSGELQALIARLKQPLSS